MTDNDHAAPTPAETERAKQASEEQAPKSVRENEGGSSDLRGPVRGSFLVRIVVHDPPASWQGPVPELPGLRDVDDLIRFQFEALTGCPVGVTSERTDQ